MNLVARPFQQSVHRYKNYLLQKNSLLSTLLSKVSVTVFIALLFVACSKKESAIPGTYRLYSDDPNMQRFIIGEDIYIRIQDDGKIVYNTTINQKPKFHNEGTYILDEKTNTLDIKWGNGKMPTKLTIQKVQEDYVIRVGETIYKKEKAAG